MLSRVAKKKYLLLDVLADLVVQLEFLLDLFQLLILKVTILDSLFGWRDGRSEEVEEGLCGLCLANKTRAVGV